MAIFFIKTTCIIDGVLKCSVSIAQEILCVKRHKIDTICRLYWAGHGSGWLWHCGFNDWCFKRA